jgi:hypothetical protein
MMFQCPECRVVWTPHRNTWTAKSHLDKVEIVEKSGRIREEWYWTLNIQEEFCPDCKRRDDK